MNPESPATEQPASTDSQPLVLVIDDSRVMRVALSRLLSKRYRVIEAEDGEQGWQAIQAHPDLELVFCDLSMPEVDGFEVLRRVRASDDKAIAGLPFVVITGHEDDEGMQFKASSMGASDFVSKPFRSAEITTRARTLIGQRRELRQLRASVDSRITRDGDTGLADRAHFIEHFDEILALALRHGLDSTCLVLSVADYPGLRARLPAEQLREQLRRIAAQLLATSRTEDAVGYLGEGHFAIAMSGAGPHGARLLSQRLAAKLAASAPSNQPQPGLHMGVSTPVSADTTQAAELIRAAQADLKPLAAGSEPQPPAATEEHDEIGAALSRVESVLSMASQGNLGSTLREELDQARAAQQAAEQANAELREQLAKLKEGARQQVAKAHQEMQRVRSQLNAVQAQFRDYLQEYPRDAQEQAALEIAQLQAVLEERDKQLEIESELRRQAQEMVSRLQAQLKEAAQQLESDDTSRGALLRKLLRRT